VSTGHAYRAFETTDDTGVGTDKDVDGPVAGFQEIVGSLKEMTGLGTGPWPAEITIENVTLGGGDWEAWECNVEEGTGAGGKDRIKCSTGTLKDSSNAGAAVNWLSGFKNVFIAPSAKKGYALFDALTTAGLLKRVSAESYAIIVEQAFMDTFLAAADALAARAALGAVIGTNVQAWDADLDTIAGLAKTSGNVIRGTGSAWASAVLAGADVSTSATAPLTGSTVEAVLDVAGGFFGAGIYKSSSSGDLTIPNGAAATFAHGLSVVPKMVVIKLKCTSAEHGYSTGDELFFNHVNTSFFASSAHVLFADATNVQFISLNNSLRIVHKTSFTEQTITAASWRLVIHAYA